jgi:3-hydroxyacyl-CoA dehydrogenase
LGRIPIVVEDGPGFVMNRILLAYLSAALALLCEGVAIEQIEQAMRDFGMALSPLEMLDEIGLDTALQSGLMLAGIVHGGQPGTELLVRLVKGGHLGRKRGTGFFTYPDKSVNPVVRSLIAQCGAAPSGRARPAHITSRLLGPMLAEAIRVLDEGKARDLRDIDLGMIFGLGFPAVRGGLFWWVDHWEDEQRREFLDGAQLGGQPGGKPQPWNMLARKQIHFYG